MYKIERYAWLFITIALLILLASKSCKRQPGDLGVVTTKTTTVTDTIQGKSDSFYFPLPYTVHDTLILDSLIYRDTGSIKRIVSSAQAQPFAYYRDTLKFDSVGFAIVEDTAYGRLIGRSYTYKILHPVTSIATAEKPNKKNKWFVGLEYNYPINYTGGAALVQIKDGNLFKVAVGAVNNKISYGLGFYLNIK